MFQLPELPYAQDALAPHISAETMSFHYGKHHKAYVDKLNAALEHNSDYGDDLMDVVKTAHNKGDNGVFNNAAQVWNHTFFWNSMSPTPTEVGDSALKGKIDAFGGMDALRAKFIENGLGQFGSGWVWIVERTDGTLDVVKTANAELPQLQGLKPLLTCDVWEHAYYLDYQNNRGGFLGVFFDTLANWTFAAEQLSA